METLIDSTADEEVDQEHFPGMDFGEGGFSMWPGFHRAFVLLVGMRVCY